MKATSILKNRFFSHSPFRLVHDITYQCNCKCKICERWKKSTEIKDELTIEEISNMLRDAKKAGILLYVVEGGEPLLHKDLPEILQYAKRLDFHTTIVTNGFYLKERYKEIIPFTDSITISIDAHDTLHDKMRGLNGLLEKAIEGIKLCKNSDTKMMINCVLCKMNKDKIEGIVRLSEELKLPIIFQPMDIYKGYNEYLRLTKSELQKSFSQIVKLKKAGFPILNSYQYLKYIINCKSYVCHAPKCYTYIIPNGNIVSCCDIIDQVWGNIRDITFKEIFISKDFKEFNKKMEKCNKCSISAVIETSLAYSFKPKYLYENIFKSRISYF